MQKQLIALLEVVKQVAQTSMVDLCVADRSSPVRLSGLRQAEQAGLTWLTEQVMLAERVVVVPNIRELPQVLKFLNQGGAPPAQETLQFYAGFPVRQQQQIVGVLSVMARCHHTLSPNQQSAIATLADQLGYLLHADPDAADFGPTLAAEAATIASPAHLASAASWHFLERGRAAVMRLSMSLQQCLSLEDLHNQLIAVLPHELPIAAFELLLNQGAHAPQRVCIWPADAQSLQQEGQIVCHSSADARTCLLTKQGNTERLKSFSIPSKQSAKGNLGDWPVCHCYPLTIKHRTIGALKIYFHSSAVDWPISDKDCFASIAEQISITINRLQLFQKLQSDSLQDPLTKLFNRRYMMSVLTKLLERVSYGHYQVGLIMMDIDHFKRLNDTFGHDAGDQALRVIGLFLKGHARPNDAICRYGGEEFALILSDLNWEVLERRANQLCRGIRYLSLKVNQETLNITLSAGYAIAPLHGTTPATLLKAADEALYVAKRAGRDRAVGAPLPATVLDQQLRAAQSLSPLDNPPLNE